MADIVSASAGTGTVEYFGCSGETATEPGSSERGNPEPPLLDENVDSRETPPLEGNETGVEGSGRSDQELVVVVPEFRKYC